SSQARLQLCLAEDLLRIFDVLKHYSLAGQDDEDGENESANVNDSPNSRTIDAVSRMIVSVTGEDRALALFDNKQVQNQLLDTICTYPINSPLATTAVLCLGNFARTDTHCEQLVSEHSDLINQLIRNWLTSAADVRARHAASGLLKNLCLPLPNRTALVSMGLPEAAASVIDTAVVPVQANAIGILRHLLSGPAAGQTVRCLVDSSDASAFGKLLETVRTTDIDAIRCEGTRLVAATVKRIYVRRDGTADPLQDVQAAMNSAGFDLVAPLVRLVVLDGQRHPLLQQEALVALSILAAAGRASDIVRLLDPSDCAELFPSLPRDAMDDEESSEPPPAFVEVLKKLLRQDGPVWPQSALQAKSLVSQLQAATKDLPVSNGLSILRSDIVPLL
ncbi:Rap1 GTPase-GDP dissociation stimulator 1, partial [Coemansia brasiliensis]